MGIVVVGSVALDNVITPFGKNLNAPGGSATFFSLSASYFTRVRMVAVVGSDFPKKYINLFTRHGIDVGGLEVKKGKTFHWSGSYGWDFDTANTLKTELNLFRDFKPKIPQGYSCEKAIFLANIDPSLQLDVLDQVRAPRLVAADTMNFWIENKKDKLMEVLKRVDILTINEAEAKQLTKQPNLLKAAKTIISYGPHYVVIKRGSSGLLFISKNNIFALPAYPVESVLDPTGAGDTFAGGFLGYLSSVGRFNEKDIRKALVYGAVMASFNVESFDIRALSGLNKGKIEKRVKEFKRICSFG